ncbi:MAG: sialate O-acetylesterase, partial [Pseudomonadales bacterium]
TRINFGQDLWRFLMPAFKRVLALVSVFILSGLASQALLAEVRLPRVISDGVVLQRDQAVPIWGWADDGEEISLVLNGRQVASTVAEDGKWQVVLPEQGAGGPYTLEVRGNNTLRVNDLYFGDVWLAAGQSNMQTSMGRVQYTYPEEVATADEPLIRLYTKQPEYDFDGPREDYSDGEWQVTNTDNIKSFSAVAYFFAKNIHAQTGVPIGIINTAVGGSTAEGYIREEQLAVFPKYLNQATAYRDHEYFENIKAGDRAKNESWRNELDNNDAGLNGENPWYTADLNTESWDRMLIPGYWADTEIGQVNGSVWFRREINLPESAAGQEGQLWLGRIIDADIVYVNGERVGNTTYQYPPRRYSVPEGLLKAGSNSIAVRVISNTGRGGFVPDKPYWLKAGDLKLDLTGEWKMQVGFEAEPLRPDNFIVHLQPLGYGNAMISPIENYRFKGALWYQGESNASRFDEYEALLKTMIADWRDRFNDPDMPFIIAQLPNFMEPSEEPQESDWAEMRAIQLNITQTVDNTALAVNIDAGEWNDIHPLRKKIVGDRMALAARSLVYKETDLVASGPEAVCYSVRNGEVEIRFDSVGNGLSSKGTELAEFAIKGANSGWQWTSAHLDGETVVVDRMGVQEPISIRYAWADNPDKANLYNAEGLPASSFELAVECN